jgi:hypothetical protein
VFAYRFGPTTALYGTTALPFVIPRVCNFIGFEKKLMLKTKGLGASKVAKINKVTDSERSRGICSSADSSWQRRILPSNKIVISTGGVMGLRPTQGN